MVSDFDLWETGKFLGKPHHMQQPKQDYKGGCGACVVGTGIPHRLRSVAEMQKNEVSRVYSCTLDLVWLSNVLFSVKVEIRDSI